MSRVGLRLVDKGPPEELVHVLPFYIRRRGILEPLHQVGFRVRDVALAALEERPPVLAAGRLGMYRGGLEVGFAREVDDEVEGRLEGEPGFQDAGDVVGGVDEGGRQCVEDAERRDVVQKEDACPDEDVVPARRSDHGGGGWGCKAA